MTWIVEHEGMLIGEFEMAEPTDKQVRTLLGIRHAIVVERGAELIVRRARDGRYVGRLSPAAE